MKYDISILVRTRNDAAFIGRTLDAIASQKGVPPFEVVVCNDASTDGTTEILAKRGDIRLVERPAGEYFPGRTLNAMVRAAQGEIVVFNNADAIPLDDRWLATLIAPLLANEAGATFCSRCRVPTPRRSCGATMRARSATGRSRRTGRASSRSRAPRSAATGCSRTRSTNRSSTAKIPSSLIGARSFGATFPRRGSSIRTTTTGSSGFGGSTARATPKSRSSATPFRARCASPRRRRSRRCGI